MFHRKGRKEREVFLFNFLRSPRSLRFNHFLTITKTPDFRRFPFYAKIPPCKRDT